MGRTANAVVLKRPRGVSTHLLRHVYGRMSGIGIALAWKASLCRKAYAGSSPVPSASLVYAVNGETIRLENGWGVRDGTGVQFSRIPPS